MINKNALQQYCSEDISLIQNYDKAVADKTHTWHCHHKLEAWFTASELKQIGRYKNVPARELILLPKNMHFKWPHKGRAEGSIKSSKSRRGKHYVEGAKASLTTPHNTRYHLKRDYKIIIGGIDLI